MLVVPVEVRRSKINGRGIYALKNIRKGTIVLRAGSAERHYTREEIMRLSERYRKIITKFGYWEKEIFVYPTDEAKYFNHSCDSNVKNFGNVDKAVRSIKKGDELTYDYSHIYTKGKSIECLCGAKNCRGMIFIDGLF